MWHIVTTSGILLRFFSIQWGSRRQWRIQGLIFGRSKSKISTKIGYKTKGNYGDGGRGANAPFTPSSGSATDRYLLFIVLRMILFINYYKTLMDLSKTIILIIKMFKSSQPRYSISFISIIFIVYTKLNNSKVLISTF